MTISVACVDGLHCLDGISLQLGMTGHHRSLAPSNYKPYEIVRDDLIRNNSDYSIQGQVERLQLGARTDPDSRLCTAFQAFHNRGAGPTRDDGKSKLLYCDILRDVCILIFGHEYWTRFFWPLPRDKVDLRRSLASHEGR